MIPILAKIQKCIKYHDFKTASYLSLYLTEKDPEYTVLAGIILYHSGEYSRAIPYLLSITSTTSVFYRALAYRRQKKYDDAIHCIEMILNGHTQHDKSTDEWYSCFFVNETDKEFYYSFLSELYTLSGKSQLGIKYMTDVMTQNPLIPAVECLFNEGIIIKSNLPSCPVSTLYANLLDFMSANWNTKNITRNNPVINQACQNLPGTGAFLLSKVAATQARFGNIREASRIFKILRKKDINWIDELDAYSTMLWKVQDDTTLGLLAKDMISSHPNHHITWIIIGNFYSLRKKNEEAIQSFLKSLTIRENPHAYTLLGFEFNHKSRFIDAQGCFRSSLCMLENNDRAIFGLGISYAETFKKELAGAYFIKAMQINPHSLDMKAYLIRFYVRIKEYKKALEEISEYFSLGSLGPKEVVKRIEEQAGEYSELEELIICELAEILFREKKKELATKLLDHVNCRSTTYFTKRALIETEDQ